MKNDINSVFEKIEAATESHGPQEVEASWRLTVNLDTSWRDRAATLLCRIAQRLDKRVFLRLRFITWPELDAVSLKRVIDDGRYAMERGLQEEVKQEAIDRLFRKVTPTLYEENKP